MKKIFILKDADDESNIFAVLLEKENATVTPYLLQEELERRWDIVEGYSEYGDDDFDEKNFTKEEVDNDMDFEGDFMSLLGTIIKKYSEHFEEVDYETIDFA